MKFAVKRDNQETECYLKKKWRTMSNHGEFLQRLEPYMNVPDLPDDQFLECMGKSRQGQRQLHPGAGPDILERGQGCIQPGPL